MVDKDTRSSEKNTTLICCLCGEDCTAEESLELQSIYDECYVHHTCIESLYMSNPDITEAEFTRLVLKRESLMSGSH